MSTDTRDTPTEGERATDPFASCAHEWLEGRCVHCEQTPSEVKRLLRATPGDEAVRRETQRCIAIAKGCFDYMGGYSGEKLETFHHGIQTVVNALSGPDDYQRRTLERIGSAAESPAPPPPAGEDFAPGCPDCGHPWKNHRYPGGEGCNGQLTHEQRNSVNRWCPCTTIRPPDDAPPAVREPKKPAGPPRVIPTPGTSPLKPPLPASPAAPATPPVTRELSCSFCDKTPPPGRKLIAAKADNRVLICTDCVSMCVAILLGTAEPVDALSRTDGGKS